jgi:carboxymethylenebutenolidase
MSTPAHEPSKDNQRDEGLVQYLVSEFVEDYQEGHMTRRDALKRIAGILGSLVLAENLLAACAPPAAPAVPTAQPEATTAPTRPPATAIPPTAMLAQPTSAPTATGAPQATATTASSGATGVTISPDDPAIEAGPVQFQGQGATILAYLARPKGNGPFPAVLVCHENRGLLEHIKDVARRLGKAGYVGLAVDLLSRQGGTDKIADAAQVPGLLANAPAQQLVQDFKDGVTYLQGQPFVSKDRIGMVGFCFGGGITWRCATQIPELKAAVPFYGPNPPLEDVPKINAAVLAMYGALDTRITSGSAAIEAAMKQNNKTFDKIIYPNANHAFHNDTGANYNAEAAKDAWAKTLAWFDKYLRA